LEGMKFTSFTLHLWPGGAGSPPIVRVLRPSELNVLREMPLTSLSLPGQDVGGLSVVTDLPRLTHLNLERSWSLDLRRLEELKQLKSLNRSVTGVRDLGPLEGLPLESLNFDNCRQLSDLKPLGKVSSLKALNISRTGVRDLSPLAELRNLETIVLEPQRFGEGQMKVLRGLKKLRWIRVGTARHPAAQFWKKYDAGGFRR